MAHDAQTNWFAGLLRDSQVVDPSRFVPITPDHLILDYVIDDIARYKT